MEGKGKQNYRKEHRRLGKIFGSKLKLCGIKSTIGTIGKTRQDSRN